MKREGCEEKRSREGDSGWRCTHWRAVGPGARGVVRSMYDVTVTNDDNIWCIWCSPGQIMNNILPVGSVLVTDDDEFILF